MNKKRVWPDAQVTSASTLWLRSVEQCEEPSRAQLEWDPQRATTPWARSSSAHTFTPDPPYRCWVLTCCFLSISLFKYSACCIDAWCFSDSFLLSSSWRSIKRLNAISFSLAVISSSLWAVRKTDETQTLSCSCSRSNAAEIAASDNFWCCFTLSFSNFSPSWLIFRVAPYAVKLRGRQGPQSQCSWRIIPKQD